MDEYFDKDFLKHIQNLTCSNLKVYPIFFYNFQWADCRLAKNLKDTNNF